MLCPHMFGCPLYIHNTKKACFVRLRGYPYAPIHLDAVICLDGPLYVWMPSICLPVCLDDPICLDALVCLDASCALGHPPCLDAPICLDDVWMPLSALMPSICLDTPCMFGCLICLDTPICLDAHLYVWTPP